MNKWVVAVALGIFLFAAGLAAQEAVPVGPSFVSEPSVPTLSPAVRDLPAPVLNSHLFGREMQRREDYGFISTAVDPGPHDNPLLDLQRFEGAPQPDGFGTPILNFSGATSPSSPPDTTGDVGFGHFLQAINGTGSIGTSSVRIFNKSGIQVGTDFSLDSLASGSPCNSGFCDPIVLFDEIANRWVISEFPSSGGHLCVYVSKTSDPTGAWWAYTFLNVESGTPDYPKYGVWPLDTNGDGQYMEGSYLIGINAGSSGKDLVALDRGRMLQGLSATFQKFTVPALSGFGFQLLLPAGHEGAVPPPTGNQAGLFLRPVDTEIHSGKTCSPTPCDIMEMYSVLVDWATPASSTVTKLPDIRIAEFDHTLCGTGGTWNCMPQPGTSQKIDPIREPIHFPLQYRNFGDHQSLVGCFAEDVDGTDHAAMRWFEIRKSGATWSLFQEGVVGGEANVHRSIGSAAMDGSGNIAMGYTRTGTTAPNYPSIYYKGRLSTDTPGTMPQGEYVIFNASTSKTDNERYGDYAGIGVDPSDDCTFWFVTEYGGSGQTKIASFKFDACGCLAIPAAPVASASATQANRIAVSWNDSATATITRYFVFRSTVAGGPYTQIATVSDTSPGAGGSAPYTYNDNTVSGGTRYFYTVKSNDGGACTSPASAEVNALATGACTLAPTFAGITSAASAAEATCKVNLTWTAGQALCTGPLSYRIYRSTTAPFTPSVANRIAEGISTSPYTDAGGLNYNTTYHYIVRAVDGSNGVEEDNVVTASGFPTGPYTQGTWTDDAGDTAPAKLAPSAPWQVASSGGHTGPKVYLTGSYGDDICATLLTPSMLLGVSSQLSFWAKYDIESGWDKGQVELSQDGGSTWVRVPVNYPTSSTQTSDACGWGSGQNFFTGTNLTWASYSASLATWNGKTVSLRWTLSTDSNTNGTGWWVDDIAITNAQIPDTCTSGGGGCSVTCSTTVPATGSVGFPVSFQSTATPSGCTGSPAYAWTFGDGATSNLQNPSHAYATAGTFSWSFTVTVDGVPCARTGSILVSTGCSVNCTATVPAAGSIGIPVAFQSSSTTNCTGSPSYGWTFGDGATSTLQNPSHTYATQGAFTWGLTVTVAGQTCTQGGTIAVGSNCALTCGASVGPSSGMAPLTVTFAGSATTSGCSSTSVAFQWTFGDGTSSLQKNSVHEYASAGTYTWTMTATSNGLTCTKSGTITVTASCTLTCAATASPSSGVIPLTVAFSASATASNCSGSPTFLWSFGDGTTSTEKNPTHAYASAGSYTWTMTAAVSGKSCTRTGTVSASEPCAVTCIASTAPALGTAPLTVAFTALATPSNCAGAPSFLWTFGDGVTSTEQNPSHSYATAGSYNWNLTATVDRASCAKSGTITVTEPCSLSCDASATPAAGTAPLAVAFTATAEPSHCAGAASFLWAFGDGTTSTEQNPGHTFAAAGSYAWTLTATADGQNCTRTGTVAVSEPCTLSCEASAAPTAGAAPLAVVFTASATPSHCAGAVSFLWTFGDGATSTEQNPGHTFAAAGSFTWTLTATADGKTCIRTGTVSVLEPCTLSCEASASPAAGAAPLAVAFAAIASPSHCAGAVSFLWAFGDGATSTEQNPGHTYAVAGSYNWTLTGTADGKTCTKTGTVVVSPRIPGDGDGDGTVSIGEVQQAVNMFLGLQPPGNGVDCDGDGTVSIGELQKVLNAFLGVTTTC
jgi:PKD repeat protein